MKLNVMILVQLMWLFFVCFLHNFIANPRLPDNTYRFNPDDYTDDDWWRQRHLDEGGGNDQLTAFYVFAFLQVSKPRPTTQQLTNPNYCNYGI
jgi:hypothetical protein